MWKGSRVQEVRVEGRKEPRSAPLGARTGLGLGFSNGETLGQGGGARGPDASGWAQTRRRDWSPQSVVCTGASEGLGACVGVQDCRGPLTPTRKPDPGRGPVLETGGVGVRDGGCLRPLSQLGGAGRPFASALGLDPVADGGLFHPLMARPLVQPLRSVLRPG